MTGSRMGGGPGGIPKEGRWRCCSLERQAPFPFERQQSGDSQPPQILQSQEAKESSEGRFRALHALTMAVIV